MKTNTKRQEQIMERLADTGQMKVAELAQEMGVSMETIRKDLSILAEQGLIEKRHGKARILSGPLMMPLSVRKDEKVSIKQQIARKAVDFIKDGSTIWLDTGSTVLAMVPFLSMKKDLMIVTDSIVAASALMDTKHRLFVIGGLLEPRGMCLTGPSAVESLATFHFDYAFLGTNGFRDTKQPTTFSLDEVQLKREVMKRSSQSFLLADSTKFQSAGAYIYTDFSAFDCMITDTLTPEQQALVSSIGHVYTSTPCQETGNAPTASGQ